MYWLQANRIDLAQAERWREDMDSLLLFVRRK